MAANTRLAGVSLRRLEGVHPHLAKVVHAASLQCPVPFLVVEGVRTAERQKELYAQGRTMCSSALRVGQVGNFIIFQVQGRNEEFFQL